MRNYGLKDYEWLVSGMADERRQTIASQLRNDYVPEWIEEYLASYAAADPTLNKETGRKHTVESMVEELKERVRLDAIEKKASIFFPPLRAKLAELAEEKQTPEELLGEMADHILRHHIRPNHGQSSIPALYEALKDQFDIEGVEKAGGKDRIIDMLEKLRQENQKPNLADALPTYDGSPLQIGREHDEDQAHFLNSDTKKS